MKTTYNNLIINSTYKGDKNWKATGNCPSNWNNHRVTVTNTVTGKRTSFDYWESIAKHEITDDKGNITALYCFFSDAIAGDMDFDDFCNEFGYDSPSKAYHTWKECQKSRDKAQRMMGGWKEVCEVYDKLCEIC